MMDNECEILDSVSSRNSDWTDGSDSAYDDYNNCGLHTDDSKNVPDEFGRVLANYQHPPADPDVFLAPQLARAIKAHQIGGIRFLYDNVIDSIQYFKKNPGLGCILAHSMGLGKTMQVNFVNLFILSTLLNYINKLLF